MAWTGEITSASVVGSSATFTPDTTTARAYTVDSFTAPKKGIYKFELKGSGGQQTSSGSYGSAGAGGYTEGYMLLEKDQTVYIGAGGVCSAAFVASATGTKLSEIAAENLFFVAGAGGGNGAAWDANTNRGANGGNGGGVSGSNGSSALNGGNSWTAGGAGGTQTTGYAYGAGQYGGYVNVSNTSAHKGTGGDGFYGGYSGNAGNQNKVTVGTGGGGGSGYIHAETLTVGSATYTNLTQQGGGAAKNAQGSIVVTYYAQSDLPVKFNGITLEKIIFNGVEVSSLVYNGTKLFFETLKRRCAAWFTSTKTAKRLKALI